jgi:L-alanine-DL-glutamate epimerase-like enolase superfamily enzyme
VHVTARIVELELAETFSISGRSTDVAEVVHIEIEHAGERGFGEAAPFERYDESAASAEAFVEQHGDLLGDDPFAFAEIEERLGQLPGEQAAKAGIEAALHDVCGKLVGVPVWRFLGLRADGPPTSYTVVLDDPDSMARQAERDAMRFLRLKLKLGGRDGLDAERVRAVRAVTDLPLQVDANEGWSLEEAFETLPLLAELGVEYCEQPLPAGDPGGPELRRRSPMPLYVDEDCHTLADVAPCAERANGINIKLAKSGGIREALRMIHAARALDLGVMIGCMLESGLGIAAAAQIASLCDFVDLDSNLLLRHDPWPGVRFEDGRQLPSNAPGLGVQPALLHPHEQSTH